MLRNRFLAFLFGLCVFVIGTGRSDAGFFTFTVSGTYNSQPLNAKVEFTTGAGFIEVVLYNLTDNPVSSVSGISGVTFQTTAPVNLGTTSIASAKGDLINIDSSKSGGGAYTDKGVSGAYADDLKHWGLKTPATNLTTLTGGQPEELIVGNPDKNDKYSAANTGFDNFNPWVKYTAKFNISAELATIDTVISGGTIAFGTAPEDSLEFGQGVVPVPSGIVLASIGGICCLGERFRRRIALKTPPNRS